LRAEGLAGAVAVGTSRETTRQILRAHASDHLIIIGGDGTIAAVINGMDRSRQCLAVLPCGHGNCLARDLGVPDIARAMQALRAGSTRWIDLMRVHLRQRGDHSIDLWAASTVALGYVADVVQLGRRRLPALGRHAYAVASLLTRPHRRPVSIRADQALLADDVLTGVVVNNTAHLANFRGLPRARLDDGRLDLLLLDAGWPRQVLHNAAVACGSGAIAGRWTGQAAEVEVRAAQPGVVMVDGELFDDVEEVSIRCVPKALCCIGAPVAAPR
jgi:diacylglycerol kinase family enzyme